MFVIIDEEKVVQIIRDLVALPNVICMDRPIAHACTDDEYLQVEEFPKG